jgi:hypothetical protein
VFATPLHHAPAEAPGVAPPGRRPVAAPTAASVAAIPVLRDDAAPAADGSGAGLVLLAIALLLVALGTAPWSPRFDHGALAHLIHSRTELAASGIAILASLAVAALLAAA